MTKLAFLKLLQNLPEIYKTDTSRRHFRFLTSPIKNSKFRGADGADACGMAKYIDRTKRGCIELPYVSENGSAGPDFPDLWRNPPGGVPQHIYIGHIQPLKGLYMAYLPHFYPTKAVLYVYLCRSEV